MDRIKQEKEDFEEVQETKVFNDEYIEFESEQMKTENNLVDGKYSFHQDNQIKKKRKMICNDGSIATDTKVKEEVFLTARNFEKELLSKDQIVLDLREQLLKKDQLIQQLDGIIRTNNQQKRISNETGRMASLELRRNKQEVFRLSQENKTLETKNKELLISQSMNPDKEVFKLSAEKYTLELKIKVLEETLKKNEKLSAEKYTLELKIKVLEETLKKTEKQPLAIQNKKFEQNKNKQEVIRLRLESKTLRAKIDELLRYQTKSPIRKW